MERKANLRQVDAKSAASRVSRLIVGAEAGVDDLRVVGLEIAKLALRETGSAEEAAYLKGATDVLSASLSQTAEQTPLDSDLALFEDPSTAEYLHRVITGNVSGEELAAYAQISKLASEGYVAIGSVIFDARELVERSHPDDGRTLRLTPWGERVAKVALLGGKLNDSLPREKVLEVAEVLIYPNSKKPS